MLHKRPSAEASSDNDNAAVPATAMTPSIPTNRFSRTPKPFGVMGKDDMQKMIGTITSNAVNDIFKSSPAPKTEICTTKIIFKTQGQPNRLGQKRLFLSETTAGIQRFLQHCALGQSAQIMARPRKSF